MNLVDFQPSTIAAAAVLAAWDARLTKRLVESKTSLLSCCGSLDAVSPEAISYAYIGFLGNRS